MLCTICEKHIDLKKDSFFTNEDKMEYYCTDCGEEIEENVVFKEDSEKSILDYDEENYVPYSEAYEEALEYE